MHHRPHSRTIPLPFHCQQTAHASPTPVPRSHKRAQRPALLRTPCAQLVPLTMHHRPAPIPLPLPYHSAAVPLPANHPRHAHARTSAPSAQLSCAAVCALFVQARPRIAHAEAKGGHATQIGRPVYRRLALRVSGPAPGAPSFLLQRLALRATPAFARAVHGTSMLVCTHASA
ncbi:hypothetical protein PLICRDRAFT_179052 [Plicaturopsis crispa FD-325 SS-3]|uniref:Uncharacterized protein n=1 Tax=Plicaturopsis crispa FD-325 SS-3 TaxID=944288 RepID=A0A0C9SL17_PLICR|nr:hypothetical protein PLICRDRAFT_179052 [Plicaturopsis crispa FD-325 SS-3]